MILRSASRMLNNWGHMRISRKTFSVRGDEEELSCRTC